MRCKANRFKVTFLVAAALAAALSLAIILVSGCTDRLAGELNANHKPVVYFVNIPPEGQSFSRNPVIHWVGTDDDGLIVFFDYHVATVQEVGGMDPIQYATEFFSQDLIVSMECDSVVTDTGLVEICDTTFRWSRLYVDLRGPEPRTTNVVAMSADLSDPVRQFVDQYVFLRAFDEQGLSSDIVYRLFSRNDNPPNTVIYGFRATDTPFVNAVDTGGIITGVRVRWAGTDPIDYPSDPPPFEFEWRLYGPYDDDQLATITEEYLIPVYLTNEGLIYRNVPGDDDTTFVRCDTATGLCDTLIVLETSATARGSVDTVFRVDDADFKNSPLGDDKLVYTSEEWILATNITMWNVFKNFHSDTTLQMNYMFWVRSRDDAGVPDPVPAYQALPVINPRYERDIAVLDFNGNLPAYPNNPISDDVKKAYWYDAINTWGAASGYDIIFDTTRITEGPMATMRSSPDFFWMPKFTAGVPIGELLKHKVLILYNDRIGAPGNDQLRSVYRAIDGGVNVWATMRCPVIGSSTEVPEFDVFPPVVNGERSYTRYFGVESVDYSAWFCHLPFLTDSHCDDKGFYQDFIGAFSRKPGEWPELAIDTALLHSNYKWMAMRQNTWDPIHPALPEVNWAVRSFGSEILYKYKSLYGQSHPLGFTFSFHGRPVAHRLETSLFRTVHFMFTPLAIETDSMQVVVNLVLDWLYDPSVGATINEVRYHDAPVRMSVSEARESYERRCQGYEDMLRAEEEMQR